MSASNTICLSIAISGYTIATGAIVIAKSLKNDITRSASHHLDNENYEDKVAGTS